MPALSPPLHQGEVGNLVRIAKLGDSKRFEITLREKVMPFDRCTVRLCRRVEQLGNGQLREKCPGIQKHESCIICQE